MTYIREPTLKPVSIDQLHPTQITVGMREVEDKRKRLQARPPEKIGKTLEKFADVDAGPVQIEKPLGEHSDGNDTARQDRPHEQAALLDVVDHRRLS